MMINRSLFFYLLSLLYITYTSTTGSFTSTISILQCKFTVNALENTCTCVYTRITVRTCITYYVLHVHRYFSRHPQAYHWKLLVETHKFTMYIQIQATYDVNNFFLKIKNTASVPITAVSAPFGRITSSSNVIESIL